MFLRNAVCCFENDFVGAGFHARGSSKRLPYNRYLPPLCKGRGTIEDGGGIVAYQMRRRHRTSSLLPFTYYFCTRDVEGVVPYSFSLRYVINAVPYVNKLEIFPPVNGRDVEGAAPYNFYRRAQRPATTYFLKYQLHKEHIYGCAAGY